ncbi:hypothetical protein D3C87_1183020 [compost metagenome]
MNQPKATLLKHAAMQTLILLGFAIYISYLSLSGHINYYIAPRMQSYVELSAAVLFLMAAYHGYHTYRKLRGLPSSAHSHHEPPRSAPARGALNSLFLFPVLLGFLVPDSFLGSSLAAKKGLNLAGSIHSRQTPITLSSSVKVSGASLAKLFPSDKYTGEYAKLGMKLYQKDHIQVKDQGYVEILTALQLYPGNFGSKPIDISGFVYREPSMKPNQFVIARFNIQCCTADAMPLGVLVEMNGGDQLKTDSWVHLSGKLGETSYGGNQVLKLDAEKAQPISAPDNVYVQPSLDFSFEDQL